MHGRRAALCAPGYGPVPTALFYCVDARLFYHGSSVAARTLQDAPVPIHTPRHLPLRTSLTFG